MAFVFQFLEYEQLFLNNSYNNYHWHHKLVKNLVDSIQDYFHDLRYLEECQDLID